MTNQEFWDFFCVGDTKDKYDEICEFFSKELDDDFLENYEYMAIIYSLIDELFQNNDFEKAIDFIKLLESKQPVITEEYYEILYKYVINYYTYLGNTEQLDLVLSNCLKYDVTDEDLYLEKIDKLIYYQFNITINKHLFEKFKDFPNIKEITPELMIILFEYQMLITIEKIFYKENNTKEQFIKDIELAFPKDENEDIGFYPIGIANELIRARPSKEELQKLFEDDKEFFLFQLKIQFFKYMHEKNIGFYLSNNIWENTINLFNHKKEYASPDSFFKISPRRLQKRLKKLLYETKQDNEEYFLVLWGSVYVYDFLKSIDIISDETHNHFINMTKYLKGVAIYKHFKYLWNFNFIHTWKKTDSISEEEFDNEKIIFEKTFDNYIYNFHYSNDVIKEDLENIGELSKYILDCEKKYIEQKGKKREKKKSNKKKDNILQLLREEENRYRTGFYDENEDEDDFDFDEDEEIQKPVRVEPKVGRNDPCPCGSGKKYKKCCMNK